MFELYQAQERSILEQRDARVQKLYLEKRKARQQEVLNYTTQLLNVRNQAEKESLASIKLCDQYEDRISELENLEKKKVDSLSTTMRQNQVLLQDLSRKSISMTNRLVARNPIAPIKEEPYPGHTQYSYNSQHRQSVDHKYQQKLEERLKQIQGNQAAGP